MASRRVAVGMVSFARFNQLTVVFNRQDLVQDF